MTRILASSIGILAVAATSAFAHHPGSTANTGGAGPINTISASTLEQGHFAAQITYEFIRLGGLSDAQLVTAAANHVHAHSIRTIQSPVLSVAYGITGDLMVSARLPYVLRTDIREGHHEHVGGAALNTVDARGDSRGIGDLSLLAQLRMPYRPFGTELAVLVGVKAPTGVTNTTDVSGELFEAEFQPGSGSWDGYLGLAVTRRLDRWSFDANALYVATSTGTQDTDLGDRFQFNFAVSYRAMGYGPADPTNAFAHAPPGAGRSKGHAHSHSHGPVHHHDPGPAASQFALDLILELNGEYHEKQVTAGVADPNSGGTTIYVSPGFRASYGSVSGFASVGIPIANYMNGLQSMPDYRIVAGLAAGF